MKILNSRVNDENMYSKKNSALYNKELILLGFSAIPMLVCIFFL